MGHAEPFVKACRNVERGQRYDIRVDRQLGKSREKVKYGEDRAAGKCVEYFVDTGNCDLWYLGGLVQLLVVDDDTDATRLCLGRIPRGSTKGKWNAG